MTYMVIQVRRQQKNRCPDLTGRASANPGGRNRSNHPVLEVRWAIGLGVALVIGGCGPRFSAQSACDAQESRLRALDDDVRDARDEIDKLKKKLRDEHLAAETERATRAQAFAEYEQRLAQLTELAARLRDLRTKLLPLASYGVSATVRLSRITIQLSGSAFFSPGSTTLGPEARRLLHEIASRLVADPTLAKRTFQVVGHADAAESATRDPWALSLSRARAVLAVLPPSTPDTVRWSVAALGTTDPIAGSLDRPSLDEQRRNRRIELVLQQAPEECLFFRDPDR